MVAWLRRVQEVQPETICDRFISLFEHHDVHRNQIPRFFGHGLTLKDIQDDELLLQKLDQSLIDAVCQMFSIRCEWLEGVDRQIYPCHDFYKNPEDFVGFLETSKASNPSGDLSGVLIAPLEKHGDAVMILSELIGQIGDKPVYRHHLCNNWIFDYWKSRAYLTACVAIAWNLGVHVRGVYLPKKEIECLAAGESLLCDGENGFFGRGRGVWYPEDMALKPECFLSGIDPEQDRFGLISALELWLRLERGGYMETGLSNYDKENVRVLFEQAFSELKVQ